MKKVLVIIGFLALLAVSITSCSKDAPLPQNQKSESEQVGLGDGGIKSKNDPPRK